MTFEVVVIARELGVLSTRDMRVVSPDVQDVFAVVLHPAAPPFTGIITFGEIPGGRAVHRGLRCPSCAASKYKLFFAGIDLACAGCTRRRSRRQNESTCVSWKKYGAEQEDVVLRALGRPRSSVLPHVEETAKTLTADDRERWALLQRRVSDVMTIATAPDVQIADVLGELS